jgi:mycothiol S-conjugate amidase
VLEPRCLLTVHAHPDDESSKGAGTVSRYHAEGVHTVLVCCTGGEEGDILNPAMDTPEVRARLGEIRLEELARASQIIGYDEVVLLGYRDSGMPDSPANADPAAFANAPIDQAVGRLVEVVRRVRPQVMVIYPEEQSEYPHPDHIRAHEIGLAAFEAAGDPSAYRQAGPPFAVSKLYYTVWPRERMRKAHEKFLELGLESPFDQKWMDRLSRDTTVPTTSVDISGHDVRGEALRAHATQVDPTSSFWFGLPPEVQATLHPFDDYVLARSWVGDPVVPEHDLFSGIAGVDGKDGATPGRGERARRATRAESAGPAIR